MVFLRVILVSLLVIAPVSFSLAKPVHPKSNADIAQHVSGSGIAGAVSASAHDGTFSPKAPFKRCLQASWGQTLCTSCIMTPVRPVSCAALVETRLTGPRSDSILNSPCPEGIFHPPRS